MGLIFVLICSFALQFNLSKQTPVPYYDETFYLDVAENILDTGLPYRSMNAEPGTLSFRHPPLGRYLSAGVAALFGKTLSVQRWFSGCLSFLTLALFFFALRRRYEPTLAFCFTLLLATQSLFLVFAHSAYTEMLLTLLCFSGFLFFCDYNQLEKSKQRRPLVLAAIFFGFAFVTKYTALFYFFPLALFNTFLRKRYRDSALFLLIIGLPLFCWLAIAAVINPELLVEELLSFSGFLGADNAGEYSTNVTLAFFITKELLPAVGPLLLGIVLLAPLGLLTKSIFLRDRWQPSTPFILAAAIVTLMFLVVSIVTFKKVRYLVIAMPLLIWIASELTAACAKQIASNKQRLFVGATVLALFCTSTPVFDLALRASHNLIGRPRQFPGYYSDAANYSVYYRGLDRVGADLRREATDCAGLVAGDGRFDVFFRYYSDLSYCYGVACKEASFLLFNPKDANSQKKATNKIDDIKNYSLLATYNDMGSEVGDMQLWRRNSCNALR